MCLDHFSDVGRNDRNSIEALHAAIFQSGGQTLGAFEQFAIVEMPLAIDHGRLVGKAAGGSRQEADGGRRHKVSARPVKVSFERMDVTHDRSPCSRTSSFIEHYC